MTSRRPALRRWSLRNARTVLAALLAGMVLALAVYAGPHLIEHLLGRDGDADHCAICVALQGVRATSLAAPPALIPMLPVAGALSAIHTPICLLLALPFSSSRAPPVLL